MHVGHGMVCGAVSDATADATADRHQIFKVPMSIAW